MNLPPALRQRFHPPVSPPALPRALSAFLQAFVTFRWACLALMLLGMGVGSLGADGGTLRVGNLPMGAYRVNVFTDPTPITPDSIDVSILVTFERGRGVAQGLEIEVEAEPADGLGAFVRHPATQEQADDPRYYAAKFALGAEGLWDIKVRLSGPEGEGETSFQVRVQEPGLFGNPYLILAVALFPLVLVGWWLKRT